jgi:hypothetical protein
MLHSGRGLGIRHCIFGVETLVVARYSYGFVREIPIIEARVDLSFVESGGRPGLLITKWRAGSGWVQITRPYSILASSTSTVNSDN